jgi:hypothetical protein
VIPSILDLGETYFDELLKIFGIFLIFLLLICIFLVLHTKEKKEKCRRVYKPRLRFKNTLQPIHEDTPLCKSCGKPLLPTDLGICRRCKASLN